MHLTRLYVSNVFDIIIFQRESKMQLSTEKKGVNTGTAHIGFSRGIAVEHGAMLPRLKH